MSAICLFQNDLFIYLFTYLFIVFHANLCYQFWQKSLFAGLFNNCFYFCLKWHKIFLPLLSSEPSRSTLQRAQARTQTQSYRQAEEQAKDSGKVCVEGKGEKRTNTGRDGRQQWEGQQSVREDRCVFGGVWGCKLTNNCTIIMNMFLSPFAQSTAPIPTSQASNPEDDSVQGISVTLMPISHTSVSKRLCESKCIPESSVSVPRAKPKGLWDSESIVKGNRNRRKCSKSLQCAVCKVTVNSGSQLEDHYKGTNLH